jgi:hypothetical protein
VPFCGIDRNRVGCQNCVCLYTTVSTRVPLPIGLAAVTLVMLALGQQHYTPCIGRTETHLCWACIDRFRSESDQHGAISDEGMQCIAAHSAPYLDSLTLHWPATQERNDSLLTMSSCSSLRDDRQRVVHFLSACAADTKMVGLAESGRTMLRMPSPAWRSSKFSSANRLP